MPVKVMQCFDVQMYCSLNDCNIVRVLELVIGNAEETWKILSFCRDAQYFPFQSKMDGNVYRKRIGHFAESVPK